MLKLRWDRDPEVSEKQQLRLMAWKEEMMRWEKNKINGRTPFTLENKQDFQGSADKENKGLLQLYCSGVEFKFKCFVYKKL